MMTREQQLRLQLRAVERAIRELKALQRIETSFVTDEAAPVNVRSLGRASSSKAPSRRTQPMNGTRAKILAFPVSANTKYVEAPSTIIGQVENA